MSFIEQRKGLEAESVKTLKSEIVGHLDEMQRSIEQAKQVAYAKVTSDNCCSNNGVVYLHDLTFFYVSILDPQIYREKSCCRCSFNAAQIS